MFMPHDIKHSEAVAAIRPQSGGLVFHTMKACTHTSRGHCLAETHFLTLTNESTTASDTKTHLAHFRKSLRIRRTKRASRLSDSCTLLSDAGWTDANSATTGGDLYGFLVPTEKLKRCALSRSPRRTALGAMSSWCGTETRYECTVQRRVGRDVRWPASGGD